MNQLRYTCFLNIFFISTLLSFSALAQIPTDDTIPSPPGYGINQLKGFGFVIDSNDIKWAAYNYFPGRPVLAKLDLTKTWTIYDTTNSPLPRCMTRSLACNAMGVWLGTDSGLYNLNGAVWNWYKTTNSNIPYDSILNLYSAGGNDLWIYSNKGFVYFNGSDFKQYSTGNSGLISDTVNCVFKSSTGIWWIGTVRGLSSFDGVNWKSYSHANSFECDDNIYALNEDKNGFLFAGTLNGKLYMKSGPQFINMSYYSAFSLGAIHRLKDGRMLAWNNYQQYFISTNPINVTTSMAGVYSTYTPLPTTVYTALDKADRLWRMKKNVNSRIIYSDSLTLYPDPPASLTPENFRFNYLDVNEVQCGIGNNNSFFYNNVSFSSDNYSKYEVPKQSCGQKSIYASALWIGGFDSSGKVHVAAQTYRQSGSDFWPGPLDTVSAKLDSSTFARYDSTWKVNRSVVDEFITQYWLGNVTSRIYKIPNIILNWPAHGTGNYSRNLAPFVDKNSDGIYNPYDGDYPDVKGDQMLWWVMNDNFKGVHGETRGITTLGIEVQSKAYAYSCPNISINDEAANYTTFYSFDIINRSDSDYHDAYVGIWFDTDLGYYLDDYVGCRIDGDYAFTYNGDNNDEGGAGYGENPPMLSVAVLKGPQAEPNDGIDNDHDGTIDEPFENCMMNHFLVYNGNSSNIGSNPGNYLDYYRYLKSIWRNDAHVTYGGNGGGAGIGATNIPTDYFFSGMPYDTGWTEASSGNVPNDRRFLMSSGPFSLKKNESKTLDYAIVFSWDKAHPNGLNTSIAKNDADVRKVKHWFETDSFPCRNSNMGIPDIKYDDCGLFIYPNPARGQYALMFNGASKGEMELMDITGRMIKQQTVIANQRNLIDVHDLMKGLYVVRVTDSSKSCVMKVVID